MNDHHLLRKMLEDVEPGWEGHVLAGNCEYAKGEGDPDKINAANRLYALWERQGTEIREDLSCDTEHAESEEEEQEEEDNEIVRRSIVERLFKNVSWDTISEDARANLYYYACDNGLLAETLAEQEAALAVALAAPELAKVRSLSLASATTARKPDTLSPSAARRRRTRQRGDS